MHQDGKFEPDAQSPLESSKIRNPLTLIIGLQKNNDNQSLRWRILYFAHSVIRQVVYNIRSSDHSFILYATLINESIVVALSRFCAHSVSSFIIEPNSARDEGAPFFQSVISYDAPPAQPLFLRN